MPRARHRGKRGGARLLGSLVGFSRPLLLARDTVRQRGSKGCCPMSTVEEGTLSSAISNAVVKCTRDYTGRGPTKARTVIANDLIVTRPGPRIGEGLAELALAIHPDADIEPSPFAEELCVE